MTFYSFPSGTLPHSENRHVPYSPRFKWGFAWSLSFATFYSALALGIAVVQRRTYFPQYHLTVWQIIAAYYIASVACGLALAFLYFLSDRRWSSVLLGWVLGYLFYATVGIAMFGLTVFAFVFPLIAGLGVGGVALVEYDKEHPKVSADGYLPTPDQRPLLFVGVVGFLVFVVVTQSSLPDYAVYSVAAICVGAPISVWLFLRRKQSTRTKAVTRAS